MAFLGNLCSTCFGLSPVQQNNLFLIPGAVPWFFCCTPILNAGLRVASIKHDTKRPQQIESSRKISLKSKHTLEKIRNHFKTSRVIQRVQTTECDQGSGKKKQSAIIDEIFLQVLNHKKMCQWGAAVVPKTDQHQRDDNVWKWQSSIFGLHISLDILLLLLVGVVAAMTALQSD